MFQGHANLRRRDFVVGAGSTILGLLSVPAFAQSRFPAGKADYAVASVDPQYAIIYTAIKKGFLAEQGLDVAYVDAQSGTRAKQMLAADQVFAVASGTNDSIALTLAGKPSTIVLSFDRRAPYANVLVNKKQFDAGLNSFAKLAGRAIACTQPQSATWLMAIYLAEKNGIKDKVDVRGLGDFATMLAAVKSQAIDASIATYGMLDAAQTEGWGVPIFNTTDEASWNSAFGGDFPGNSCYVLQETIQKRPDAVQALVTGLVRATDWVKTATPEQIADAVYDDFLKGLPRDSVVRTLSLLKNVWNYTNLVTEDTYGRLTAIMGNGRQYSNQDLAGAPYATAVNMTFVKKARNA